jgi:CBS domain-containing protein
MRWAFAPGKSARPPDIEIAKRLIERRSSAMPVIDALGRVVGIVSEGDLMRRPRAGGQHQDGT